MPSSANRSIRNASLSSVLAVFAALAVMALPTTALASGFTAHLYASTHQPKVGRWPIKVTATRGSQKLSGSVSYRFLLDGDAGEQAAWALVHTWRLLRHADLAQKSGRAHDHASGRRAHEIWDRLLELVDKGPGMTTPLEPGDR